MDTIAQKSGPIYWGIGILALLWHGLGCVNLVQQMTPSGVASLPEHYQAFIALRPAWGTAGFALSVIAGFAGAILLLMRRPIAKPAFWLACIGAIIAFIPTVGFGEISVIVGTLLSAAFAAALAWYSGNQLSPDT